MDVQLTLPDEVAAEMMAVGVVGPNQFMERRSVDPVEAVRAIVAVAGVSGTVVSLIVDGPEAWRRIAAAVAKWRRSNRPPDGKGFALLVIHNRKSVHLELSDEPDPDALFEFLRSTLFDD